MPALRFRRPTALPLLAFGAPDQGYATARVTSPFGTRGAEFHGGLDIGNAREGDQVVAAAAGTVLAVGNLGLPWSQRDTRFASGNVGGLMVVIEHGPGIVSVYAHLQRATVKRRAPVDAGDVIGLIGSSGIAAPPPLGGGAHLHFGIQAPAPAVPAGVKVKATAFGLGLDVDPWPLITDRAVLDTGGGYVDVPTDHRDAAGISWLTSTGLTSGTGRGRFDPDRPVTRGELATFLHRYDRLAREDQ